MTSAGIWRPTDDGGARAARGAGRKAALAAAFGAAAERYEAHAGVQRLVAERLAERLARLPLPNRPRVLEIGCGTGLLSRALRRRLGPAEWVLSDISPAMVARCRAGLGVPADAVFLAMDGEHPCLAPGRGFDLICSSLAVQWFNDLGSALAGWAGLLAPGGRIGFATLTRGSLGEWCAAHAAAGLAAGVPAFPAVGDLQALWPAGGSGRIVEEAIVRTHADGRSFLAELRAIGAHLPADGHRPLSAGALRRLLRGFGPPDGIAVTWRIAYAEFQRAPWGDAPRGSALRGEALGAGASLGEAPGGSAPLGEPPSVGAPLGEAPGGSASLGEPPAAGLPLGEAPGAGAPLGEPPCARASPGEAPGAGAAGTGEGPSLAGGSHRPAGVFVTGTDTGVGKTVVAACLVRAWDAAYWKPVQTGAGGDPGDTATVAALVGGGAGGVYPPAVVLEAPLSPYAAAILEGRTLGLDEFKWPAAAAGVARPVVVEGAGGLLVPLADGVLMIDLIARLGLPVVLVARTTLGTINHTLLSLEALRVRGLAVAGVILNGPPDAGNRAAIERFGGVRVLAELPWVAPLDAAAVDVLAARIPAPAEVCA